MRALLLCLASISATARTLPFLSNVFSSSMVLPASEPLLWGFAPAGDSILVTVSGLTRRATADAAGVWRALLPAGLVGEGPFDIDMKGARAGDAAHLADVLLGHVLLCGGQSNMEFATGALTNATQEIAEAGDPAYQRVRLMTVGKGTAAAPASVLSAIAQPWVAVNSTTIGSLKVAFGVFSAACWLTGRDIFNALNRSTPIGLITSSVSGTPIEEWAPSDAIATCPQPAHDPYPVKSDLYNAMIAPLTVGPLALMGTIWWQGEANAAVNQTAYYACQLPALITSWRSHFGGEAAWWGVVQLQAFSHYAAHNDTYDVAWFRGAQEAALALPNVSLATAIDLGDPLSPYSNIHIRDKQLAGARLAAGALARVFGLPLPHVSPRAATASCSASAMTLRVTVTFDAAAAAAGGVELRAAPACPTPAVPLDTCSKFGILGSDSKWYDADAALAGDALGVVLTATAPAGVTPVAHGYAWSSYPLPQLFTRDGALPVLPWLVDC